MLFTAVVSSKPIRARKIFVALIIVANAWVMAPVLTQAEITTPELPAEITNPTEDKSQSPESRNAAEAQLRTELKAAEEKYSKDSEQVLTALGQLARHLETDATQRKELIAVLERMVSITRILNGHDHSEVARILVSYGLALERERLNVLAEQSLLEVLQIVKPGEADGEDLVLVLDALSAIHQRSNRSESALRFSLLGFSIREKILPPDHPGIAAGLNKTALIYSSMGQYAAALPLYQRSAAIWEKVHGPDHPDTATSLDNLALNYISMREYEKALPLLQRSLLIREKAQGLEHPDTGISLNNLALLYQSMGQYAAALPLYRRSLAIREKVLGPEHPDTADSLNNLAIVYRSMAQYDKALPLYQRSLAIWEKVHGPDHPDTAISLNNLAFLYLSIAQYDKALPLYQRSLAIWEKVLGPEHPDTATGLDNLAFLYQSMAQYDKALPLYQRSLVIREKTLGPEHPDTAIGLNNLGFLYKVMGQYDKALQLYQRSLAIREKVRGSEHLDTATSLNSLAVFYELMGQYDKALPLYQRSLTIYEKVLGLEHPFTATSLNNLALLYRSIGQYDKAMPMYQRALAISEKTQGSEHPETAISLNNLAVLYYQMGQYDKAMPMYQRALAISEKTRGSEHPETATNLNNLALLYHKMGQYDKALPLYQRSAAINEKVLGPEHPDTAISLNNLGHLYYLMHKLSDSEVVFHESITRAQGNSSGRETLWRAQHGLSLLYAHLNHSDLAILWGKESVNTIQSLRTELTSLDKELQSSFLDDKRPIYQDLADLLIAEGRLTEAQEVLQMLKEQELHGSLQRSAKSDPRSTRIELSGLERRLFARYYELQDQQVALGNEREQLERKQKIGEISIAERERLNKINIELLPPLRNAMKAFLASLQKEADQYTKNKDIRKNELSLTLTETNLQKALVGAKKSNPGTRVAALQYVVTDTRLSILLSTPGAPPLARQIEVDAKALRTQIFTVHELLREPPRNPDLFPGSNRELLNQQLRKLHELLIEPIAADLKISGAQTLILVPNDVLRYVPFAALYDGEHYLIEGYALALFNEAVKKDFNAGTSRSWKLAAMGLTRAVEKLPALGNVRDELQAVTRKSGLNGKMFLDDEFTRKTLQDTLSQNFNILHLASHFEFVPGRPDASRLFLGDRTSLYLGDIAREDIRFGQFSLVTFSACETGLGGGLDIDGREMESLGALVQNQGAQAVMASLWKVEDASTAELMEQFYRSRYQDQLDMAQALRAVQMNFIKLNRGVKAKWSHLYYWAPFVLMGDWR